MATTNNLYSMALAAYQKSLAKNEALQKELRTLADQYGQVFEGWGEGQKAEIERQKKQDVSSGQAALTTSGLGKTTRSAGLAQAWEANVGTQARLKLEDMIKEKQAQAIQFKSGIIGSENYGYPDLSMLFQAAQAESATPQNVQKMPTTYGASSYGMSLNPGYTTTSTPSYSYSTPSYSSYSAPKTSTSYTVPTTKSTSTSSSNVAYQDYLTKLHSSQGTNVQTATASEYELIRKRLQAMYPNAGY